MAWSLALVVVVCAAGFAFFLMQSPLSLSVAGNYLAARQAYENGDGAAASRFYRLALFQSPDDERLQAGRFTAELWNEDYASALHLAPKLLAHPEYQNFANLLLLLQDVRGQHWAEARAHLQGFSVHPVAQLYRAVLAGYLALQQGDTETLAKAQSEINAMEHYDLTRHLQQATLYALQGDAPRAEKHYRHLLAQNSPSAWLAHNYALFLHQQGRTIEAKKLLLSYQNTNGTHALVLAAQAVLALPPTAPALNLPEAIGQFIALQVTDSGPRNYRASLLAAQLAGYISKAPLLDVVLAEVYAEGDYWQKADTHFQRVPSKEPFYVHTQIQRALLLQQHKQNDKALRVLRALRGGEEQLAVLTATADIYREQKDYAEAEEIYDELLADNPSTPAFWNIYFARGVVRERLHKWALAESDLLRAQKLSNDNPYVLNYLGYSWVDQGINLRKGLAMIERAVRSDAMNGAFVDSIGWAHFRLGDFRLAVRYLEHASELSPNDAVISDHLGDALWYVGRREESYIRWQRALTFNPEEELREQLQNKLRTGKPADYNIKSSNL